MGPHAKGAGYALLAFALYSTHDLVIKVLGGHVSAFQTIFFSALFGFPLVTLMLLGDRTAGNLIPRHPGWSVLRAVLTVATGAAGFYAFTVLPMTQTYAILFAMPLLITVLAIPMLGEKVGLHRGAAVVLGLCGVLVVLRPGSAPMTAGHGAALFAAIMGAANSVIVRKIGKDERLAVLMLYPMLATVLFSGAALAFVYQPPSLMDLSLMAVIAALAFAATLLVIAAYRLAPAAIVAPMQYSQIIWATLFGSLFFGESPDRWTMIGTAIIIASGLYIVLREKTPHVSRNSPVLSTRSRLETGLMPRISFLSRKNET